MFCEKCGGQIEDGNQFCPHCGNPVQGVQQNDVTNNQTNNTTGQQAYQVSQDPQMDMLMGILAYLGPFVFIPMFLARNSEFARFHANQGLLVFIIEAAYGIVYAILIAILKVIFPFKWVGLFSYTRGAIFNILSGLFGFVGLALSVLSIIGIVYAVQKKEKELPIIGKIKILK